MIVYTLKRRSKFELFIYFILFDVKVSEYKDVIFNFWSFSANGIWRFSEWSLVIPFESPSVVIRAIFVTPIFNLLKTLEKETFLASNLLSDREGRNTPSQENYEIFSSPNSFFYIHSTISKELSWLCLPNILNTFI